MSVLKPGFGRLATMQEAFALLEGFVPSLGTQEVSLDQAIHRVVASDVFASLDVPHFAKSAMDGYAVIASDTFTTSDDDPIRMKVIETVMPGTLPSMGVGPGTCVEIGTGAPLPEGADAVVMVEQTESEGSTVTIRRSVAPGENIIRVGSDFATGDRIVTAGTRLEPRHIGVLAASGTRKVAVHAKPVVVLFSTGPEIVDEADGLGPGRIFDINRHTIGHALRVDGCEVVDLGIVPDDPQALKEALVRGLKEGDLIVLSGGSSLGGGDLVTEVFGEVGVLHLHGVAVKPGKPFVVGTGIGPSLIDGSNITKLMIGLPGYPMSALSNYYLFVRWLISKSLGTQVTSPTVSAVMGRKHLSTVGRYEFLPVAFESGVATPVTKGSSAITALTSADGFIEIDENTEVVEKGQAVLVHLF